MNWIAAITPLAVFFIATAILITDADHDNSSDIARGTSGFVAAFSANNTRVWLIEPDIGFSDQVGPEKLFEFYALAMQVANIDWSAEWI